MDYSHVGSCCERAKPPSSSRERRTCLVLCDVSQKRALDLAGSYKTVTPWTCVPLKKHKSATKLNGEGRPVVTELLMHTVISWEALQKLNA